MSQRCKICGSQAINPGHHGRDPNTDLDLCDVCYWRKRATVEVADADFRQSRPKRRKRSEMTIADAHNAVVDFSKKVLRIAETDGASAFSRGKPNLPKGQVNVQILISGEFGDGHGLFEAIRIFAGYKLPAKK